MFLKNNLYLYYIEMYISNLFKRIFEYVFDNFVFLLQSDFEQKFTFT